MRECRKCGTKLTNTKQKDSDSFGDFKLLKCGLCSEEYKDYGDSKGNYFDVPF